MGKFAATPSTSEGTLRVTVAALMRACGENQTSLAAGLRITQGQVSRKQTGTAAWSLGDIDRLSAHYGIPVPDLLCGPTHAVGKLSHRRLASVVGGSQEVIAI
ncbi:helix-turn-helix domain-containing protein [Streptomyces albidoflavus]|uniref:helix-turn-helix domain-containing protein n=1 Tax=Streptomyces albidoflavus TaxID=1886 RepID=UPI0004C150D9|nr:helix-turn-helix transcriptional regulator [Streptomyces albidoflavus]WTC33811.1 helix-turn-helix domain-containing protein [Streptomyces albidoflavus]